MEVSATVKVMHNNQCRACEKKDWRRFPSSYDEASSSDILFYKDQKGISACSVREEFMLAKHLLSCHSWTSLSFYMFLCIFNYKFKRIQSVLLRHFVSPTHWFGALIGLVSRQNKPKTVRPFLHKSCSSSHSKNTTSHDTTKTIHYTSLWTIIPFQNQRSVRNRISYEAIIGYQS